MARLLGVVELIVAVGALAVGGPLAGASVAGLFLVFTVASWRLVADDGSAETCGCFGRFSAPPSRLHVAVNVASMAVAVLATIEGAPSLRATIRDEGGIGWALSGLAILGGLTALAMMTVLPAALAAAGDAPAGGKTVGLFRVRGVAE